MLDSPGKEVFVAGCSDDDLGEWDDFVASRSDATLFHQSAWRQVVELGLGQRTHYLLARQNGEIVGVLPLAEVKSRLFGHRLISITGGVYGGILAATPSAYGALENEGRRLAEKLEVDALELRSGPDQCDSQSTSVVPWRTRELYVTFRKEISADPETNLKGIPRRQRAMVRKGINAGLSTELTQDVPRFYRIYAESVRNLGTPVFPLRYFQTLAQVFHDQVELAVVTSNGGDVAAVMSFYYRDQVMPYFGGSRPVARALKANDFMYWELMCRAASRGVRLFDFGRSKIETGSYGFKKNWGFPPQSLDYRYYLVRSDTLPDVSPKNPRYRLFIAGWKRLPLPIANLVGPWLARNLA
jgi:FemAB-related protein (PEP-CTERM system-associated)